MPAGWYLECRTAGTTSSSDLVINNPTIGSTVSDGTVMWMMKPILKAVGSNSYKDFELININDDSRLCIFGGAGGVNGGAVRLFGQAHLKHPSESQLVASDNTNGIHEAYLTIKSDGTMIFWPTAGQNTVNWDLASSAIVEKSFGASGYIMYASGLIMQWILKAINSSDKFNNVDFPIYFPTKVINISAINTFNAGGSQTFAVEPTPISWCTYGTFYNPKQIARLYSPTGFKTVAVFAIGY